VLPSSSASASASASSSSSSSALSGGRNSSLALDKHASPTISVIAPPAATAPTAAVQPGRLTSFPFYSQEDSAMTPAGGSTAIPNSVAMQNSSSSNNSGSVAVVGRGNGINDGIVAPKLDAVSASGRKPPQSSSVSRFDHYSRMTGDTISVDALSPHFLCVYCNLIPQASEPVALRSCGHIACSTCLQQAIESACALPAVASSRTVAVSVPFSKASAAVPSSPLEPSATARAPAAPAPRLPPSQRARGHVLCAKCSLPLAPPDLILAQYLAMSPASRMFMDTFSGDAAQPSTEGSVEGVEERRPPPAAYLVSALSIASPSARFVCSALIDAQLQGRPSFDDHGNAVRPSPQGVEGERSSSPPVRHVSVSTASASAATGLFASTLFLSNLWQQR
jgi:hypothetical protein